MSMGVSEGLELEVAVVRGQEWAYRGVFLPPAMVSVGSSPSSALALPETDLPEYHELIRIYSDGGVLFFKPGMAVELRMKEGTKSNDELLKEGLAIVAGAGWKVPLGLGSKGAFRIADVSVLFKVRKRGSQQIRAVTVGEPTLCGGCRKPLQFEVVGFGCLTPCTACGTLSEVQPAASLEPLPPRPLFQPMVKDSAELPTFDAISIQKPKGVQPIERVARERLSDLPTFDAISVSVTAAGPGERRAKGEELSMPTRRLTQLTAETGSKPLKGASAVGGADLPTFDAISVLKKGALLSTESAMSFLRGGSDEEPPASVEGTELDTLASRVGATQNQQVLRGGPTHDQGSPSPGGRAPFPKETSGWETGSEVEVIIEEEDEFFAGEHVSIDLQRSYNAIPVLSRLSEATQIAPENETDMTSPPEAFAARKTRQMQAQKERAQEAETIVKLSSSIWQNGAPSGDQGAVLRSPGRGEAARRHESVAVPPSGLPEHPQYSRDPSPSVEDGDDGDDFLMGRVAIPEDNPDGATNRWLILVGGVSGGVGLALLLYALFG